MSVDPKLLAADEVVLAHARERALAYIDLVFDTAEADLVHGDTAARAAAYKNVLPHLLALARATGEEEDSAAKQARDEAQRLLDEYRAALPHSQPLGRD